MPEHCRAEFISAQLQRLSNVLEFNHWKLNQADIAIGIILRNCKSMGLKAAVVDPRDEPAAYADSSIYCLIKVEE